MSKTFKLIILFVTLTAINKVKAQDSSARMIVFQGTTDVKYNGEYMHIYNNMLNEKHDSVIVANGTFTFKRQFKEPTRYMFYSSFEVKAKHGFRPFGILVDHPSEVDFAADMENLTNSKITGSPAQDIYNHFYEQIEPVETAMMEKLYAKYGKDFVESNTPDTSAQKYKSFLHDYNEMNAVATIAKNGILEATIRKNPSSFASIVLLDRNISDLSLAKREELYGLISTVYKKGYSADRIESNISGMKKSALGSTVENFTLDDPQGKPMNFNALKGKYVLVDFWGSWCGPCHTAFPGLKNLYAKYHDKGFEILGIATETYRDAWVKDIVKEKLPWLQMIDIKGSQSISQTRFAITQFPTTVLIGPDGKIIGRYGDNGKTEADMDKQLAAIFKN